MPLSALSPSATWYRYALGTMGMGVYPMLGTLSTKTTNLERLALSSVEAAPRDLSNSPLANGEAKPCCWDVPASKLFPMILHCDVFFLASAIGKTALRSTASSLFLSTTNVSLVFFLSLSRELYIGGSPVRVPKHSFILSGQYSIWRLKRRHAVQ